MYDDDDLTFWVGDLDSYVSIVPEEDFEKKILEQELRDSKEEEMKCLGSIPLLSGKCILFSTLQQRGIDLDTWRWAIHDGEKALDAPGGNNGIEGLFLKKLLEIGRPYAFRRYARREKLHTQTALAATHPNGIRAILNQFIEGSKVIWTKDSKLRILNSFNKAEKDSKSIAYFRTKVIRDAIDLETQAINFANELFLHNNSLAKVDRKAMRILLSLLRLHFMSRESNYRTTLEIYLNHQKYREARRVEIASYPATAKSVKGSIKNWKLRHLHPLDFYFPIVIRHALARCMEHVGEHGTPIERELAVNEIALVHCGIYLMRQHRLEGGKPRGQLL